MHNDSRHNKIHALAIPYGRIVQTVRSIDHEKHLLALTEENLRLRSGLRRRRLSTTRRLDCAMRHEFWRALEEAVLGESAVDVATNFVADAFFLLVLRGSEKRGGSSGGGWGRSGAGRGGGGGERRRAIVRNGLSTFDSCAAKRSNRPALRSIAT